MTKLTATEIQNLVKRLQGLYAEGPLDENGEPEFGWRELHGEFYVTLPTPLMMEASRVLLALHAELTTIRESSPVWLTVNGDQLIEDAHQGNFGPYFKDPVEANEVVRKTLERIVRWEGEFPETGKYFDIEQTRPMSYAFCYGSSGERDYMRKLASEALGTISPLNKEPVGDSIDALRYRKLQKWMTSNAAQGWEKVSELAALGAWQCLDEMDKALDALPECNVGLWETGQGEGEYYE